MAEAYGPQRSMQLQVFMSLWQYDPKGAAVKKNSRGPIKCVSPQSLLSHILSHLQRQTT